jgi:hypothetical protein
MPALYRKFHFKKLIFLGWPDELGLFFNPQGIMDGPSSAWMINEW